MSFWALGTCDGHYSRFSHILLTKYCYKISVIDRSINNENNQCLQPCICISYLVLHLAFGYTKRGRESRPMDTVAFWVKLLSLEFPWLRSITSQGKAIVLSHKHKHMHKVHIHVHMHKHHTVFNAIYRSVPHYGLILSH